ncbi:toxin-antitoxin system YwqK family antitoxin [Filimonas effusa]|uniref:Uncharacterized protein n=1 Tax=Filimonas effusa TaxID=2508721 RepID=A0A4Q1D0T0_9BACT|nr:hypothetical protein [Filimonas effusa]RXK80485.1 hypothetical protein ESB13_23590 [Filimonas effusa]
MKYNPVTYSFRWFIGMLAIGLFGGLIANIDSSAGEQKLFTYFAYSIVAALVGVALINVGAIIYLQRKGVKSSLASWGILIASLFLLFPLFTGMLFHRGYDEVVENMIEGGDTLRIRLEYYSRSDTALLLRSRSFWKNGKKDSIWITYEKDGSILKRQHFKNGEPVIP